MNQPDPSKRSPAGAARGPIAITLCCSALLHCSAEQKDDGGGTGGATEPDTSLGDGVTLPKESTQSSLEAFLDAGTYKAAPWIGDSEPRAPSESFQPHLDLVQVYFNPSAVTSIREGNAAKAAVGSMVVKEIYGSDGSFAAVAAQYRKSEADGWFFYCKGPSDICGGPSDPEPFFAGGVNDCSNCHGEGIVAPLPE